MPLLADFCRQEMIAIKTMKTVTILSTYPELNFTYHKFVLYIVKLRYFNVYYYKTVPIFFSRSSDHSESFVLYLHATTMDY